MLHIWTNFKKNSQTLERSAIDIDEKENYQNKFIQTLSFSFVQIHKNEKRLPMEIYHEGMWSTSFLHSEVTRNASPNF